MTALENTEGGDAMSQGKSRLSRKGRKRVLNAEISPAPEPRASQRFRTNSTSESEEKSKTPTLPRKVSLSRSNPTTSSSGRHVGSSSQGGGSGGGVGGAEVGIGGRMVGVCPLSNLGNTCFLNSVLYALRFLPGFTHDLHHLHTHLQTHNEEQDSSLGQRIQFLSELHGLFVNLGKEERAGTDNRKVPPYQPYDFLEALRVVNPMFEGNRQQDAHELLHCLLDQLCQLPQDLRQGNANDIKEEIKNEDENGVSDAKRFRRRSERIQAVEEDTSKAVDLVGSKFVGRMCLETCCSECEKVTGQEETFLEVCVPVKTKSDFYDDKDDDIPSENEVFMSALCEEESIRDNNKYWCDQCLHHNEARRSVHYSQLPHNIVIHIKRFSTYSRNMMTSKCSFPMPAPLELDCFCRACQEEQLRKQVVAEVGRNRTSKPKFDSTGHNPYNLTAVVCHLGTTISSGHYLSFVRLSALNNSECPEKSVVGDSKQECTWPKCCGLQLDHITQNNILSALSEDSESSGKNAQSLWLECDDEKIKIVSSDDVTAMMRATLITPYLLFYSRKTS